MTVFDGAAELALETTEDLELDAKELESTEDLELALEEMELRLELKLEDLELDTDDTTDDLELATDDAELALDAVVLLKVTVQEGVIWPAALS